MSSLKDHIRGLIGGALHKMGVDDAAQIPVECPENPEHGHYASPVAMALARSLKKNPRDIAQTILENLPSNDFDKIEIAGAGYLNFFLSDAFLQEQLNNLLQNSVPGENDALGGRCIHVEFVSANPTGPLHIGHGRWAAVGDSLARFIARCGGRPYKEFYVNDAGVQIANLRKTIDAVSQGLPVPEDGYHGTYIKELAEESQKTGVPPETLMQKSQEETLRTFGVVFDCWFSEKTVHGDGSLETALQSLKEKKVAYESEGALWFKSTDFGDDKDRVLIKSDGSYTYFAADIAYHYDKVKRGFKELVNILGADHHGYVERISAAVHIFGGRLSVLLGQLVNLFRDGEPVRMSKRTGDIITLDEVIEEIGVDAARYLLIRRPITASLEFDLGKAKSHSDDNPVYYVQYAHARICSLLRNSQREAAFQSFTDPNERLLLLELLKFEDVLREIAFDYDLQKIPAYLEALAAAFHRFYRHCRIVGDPAEPSRLALCLAAQKTLASGLSLIGVSAPQVME